MDIKKKYKILQVHNYYQIPGGEDTVVANEKKLLEDYGHTVIQYTRDNNELKEFSTWRKLLLPFTTIFNPRTYKEVKRIIREQQIDVVHVHNTLNLISPAVYYASLKRMVPIVQTVHNFRLLCPGATFYRDGHICEDCVEHGLTCAVRHKCYRNSRAQTLVCVVSTWIHRLTGIYGKLNYISLTEFNKEKLLHLKLVHKEQIFVKPNFVVNTENLIPYEKRQKRFIFAGRLDKTKGIDVLLEAWTCMGEEALELLVCGDGPDREWCSNYVKQNCLHNVCMYGMIGNADVRRLIADSRALILPTLCYEGFPMTIAEAFSVGTPVIGSGFGNVGNLIEDGISGIRIHEMSPEGIIKAISSAIDMFAAGTEIVINEIYQEKYSGSYNEKIFSGIFSELCDRRY